MEIIVKDSCFKILFVCQNCWCDGKLNIDGQLRSYVNESITKVFCTCAKCGTSYEFSITLLVHFENEGTPVVKIKCPDCRGILRVKNSEQFTLAGTCALMCSCKCGRNINVQMSLKRTSREDINPIGGGFAIVKNQQKFVGWILGYKELMELLSGGEKSSTWKL